MDLSDPAGRTALVDDLADLLRDRPVVLAPRVLAGATPEVAGVLALTGRPPLVLATARGAGPPPEEGSCEVAWLPPREFDTVTEEVRAEDERLRTLPPEVVAAVDAFDPDRAGLVVGTPFVLDDEPVLGRPVVGGRRRAWLDLEDKPLAEEVWEAAGVPHAPSRVVPADDLDALGLASADLDEGQGVVWSGDSREGFNGGGDLVRWVTDAAERSRAQAFFAAHCDRVRVLPFLDGVPCSIHGFVTGDGPGGTAAFRPVEIAMLRRPATHELVYGGLSTTWDPPPADREAMRDAVRRTGAHLADRVGYRGFLGVDGVLTADGFRPTELNPRLSAGAVVLLSGLDGGLRLGWLLQLRATAGLGLPEAATLETLVPALDAHRQARPVALWHGPLRREPDEGTTLEVRWREGRLHPEPGGDVVAVGRSPSGLFARMTSCTQLAAGERMAPLNAALLALADEQLGTAFGEVEPAPDRR